jgi:hypothetical protein
VVLIFTLASSTILVSTLSIRDLSKNIVSTKLTNTVNKSATSTVQQTMGIVVVPYFQSSDTQWNTIFQEADRYPGTIKYVVINPCSGPCGTSLPSDWQNIISVLKSKGIKTLGYIFNNSESFANIDYYMKAPSVPTDGILFDNEGSSDNLANFKQYAEYVHNLGGTVYINPGYNYPQVTNYIKSGAADVADIYEIESNESQYILVNGSMPTSKISVILGNVTDVQEMKSKLTEVASKGIGITYLYSSSYDTLPPFFSEEIQSASITPIKNQ